MLNVTDNAKALVNGLATEAGVPETGGLRIAMTEDQAQLEVGLVPEPQDTDQIVESGEAKVFVAEGVSTALEEQTLDAAQTEEGVGFTLQPQEPTA